MCKVYFEIIHEGLGEQRFDGKCLEIECEPKEVPLMRERIQAAIDAWKHNERNANRLDEYGSAKSDFSPEELLAILPPGIHARIGESRIRSAFV